MQNNSKLLKNVEFELTYSCNLDCMHCYNDFDHLSRELSLNQILGIIDQTSNLGIKEIHLNGGEPLLKKGIGAILKHSVNVMSSTVLETNGIMLNEYLSTLKDLPKFSIRVSVDGDNDSYGIIRKVKFHSSKNMYNTVLENIGLCISERIPIQATMSVNKINFKSIYSMVSDLYDCGLNDARLRLTMPTGTALFFWDQMKLCRDDLRDIEKQIDQIENEYSDFKLNASSIKRSHPKEEEKIYIAPNGAVKLYGFIKYFIGDLKIDSLSDIVSRANSYKLPENEEMRMVGYLKSLDMLLE